MTPLVGAARTALAPLRARAHDAARARPLLGDRWARWLDRCVHGDTPDAGPPPALGAVVRTRGFDALVRRFLAAAPAGTVIEVGAGLNTRCERLAHPTATWLDVDLPEVIALRERWLPACASRRHLAASVLDPAWLEPVLATPSPRCFVLEAVLGHLGPTGARQVLAAIARRCPDATVLLDVGRRARIDGDRLWVGRAAGEGPAGDADPLAAIAGWGIGLTLVEVAACAPVAPGPPARIARYRVIAAGEI